MAKNTIVFTGGGSAGHVTPNIAIIKELGSEWDIPYIGSLKGIEKDLIEKIHIPYYGIRSGKLRRYLDLENFIDVFRVISGCLEARRILKKLKPNLVFSKGGFVSVPVVVAARSLRIPIFIHESDITTGLANKIAQRFATKIFTSFDETVKYFPGKKAVAIGSPIRREITKGSAERGRRFLGFDYSKPVLTIMGGSLGAKKINETVRGAMNKLTEEYQIVHLCGKGNIDTEFIGIPGYRQFEYINEELPDILAATDFVITRGGSNSIFEFLTLEIPMIIIPLTLQQSRGDQILNANSFEKKGYALKLEEEDLDGNTLVETLELLKAKKNEIQNNMMLAKKSNALDLLVAECRAITEKTD